MYSERHLTSREESRNRTTADVTRRKCPAAKTQMVGLMSSVKIAFGKYPTWLPRCCGESKKKLRELLDGYLNNKLFLHVTSSDKSL